MPTEIGGIIIAPIVAALTEALKALGMPVKYAGYGERSAKRDVLVAGTGVQRTAGVRQLDKGRHSDRRHYSGGFGFLRGGHQALHQEAL